MLNGMGHAIRDPRGCTRGDDALAERDARGDEKHNLQAQRSSDTFEVNATSEQHCRDAHERCDVDREQFARQSPAEQSLQPSILVRIRIHNDRQHADRRLDQLFRSVWHFPRKGQRIPGFQQVRLIAVSICQRAFQ